MFGFGKKKKSEEAPAPAEATPAGPLGEELVAPATGTYKPLTTVADPVFAQGMMGEGFAVDPSEGTVVAPVTGEIALLQDSLHAFMIRSEDGAEVLVHVGIDTVELGGRGFTSTAEIGQKVTAGEPLITVDWAKIESEIPSKEVMVIVTNSKAFGVARDDETQRPVTAGDKVANTVKK